MSEFPPCPSCNEEITYPDRENYVCATCGHEWPMNAPEVSEEALRRLSVMPTVPRWLMVILWC